MPAKTDSLVARQEFILRHLQETGSVCIDELCTALDASVTTIRRDLETLEGRSLLRRARGGAVPIGPLFYEPFRHGTSFQDRVNSFADEKRRNGAAAATLEKPGQTIALSGGATTTDAVRSLRASSNITIITNTVSVAMELSGRKGYQRDCDGGHLRAIPEWRAQW